MLKNKTNKEKGNIGLGEAISYFTRMGYVVSIPLNDTQKYDLIIDMGDMVCRVDVKTTTEKSKNGVYIVDLRTNGGNQSRYINESFDNTKLDYLFIFTEEDTWYIPTKSIKSKRSINLGKKYKKYKL